MKPPMGMVNRHGEAADIILMDINMPKLSGIDDPSAWQGRLQSRSCSCTKAAYVEVLRAGG